MEASVPLETTLLSILVPLIPVLLFLLWRQKRSIPDEPTPFEIRIGCGAGYAGDRILPAAALVPCAGLDYLFLECLAERTLAIAHARMARGEPGYDPRIREWMATLLPLCARHSCKLIANLGAADPEGGAAAAAFVAGQLGLSLKVVGIGEPPSQQRGSRASDGASYTYLGADAVQRALGAGADVVITGRVADPSLVVGVAAHAFGWDLADASIADKVATATCAGHLLECGMHLTGGFFFHPEGRCSIRDPNWLVLDPGSELAGARSGIRSGVELGSGSDAAGAGSGIRTDESWIRDPNRLALALELARPSQIHASLAASRHSACTLSPIGAPMWPLG